LWKEKDGIITEAIQYTCHTEPGMLVVMYMCVWWYGFTSVCTIFRLDCGTCESTITHLLH